MIFFFLFPDDFLPSFMRKLHHKLIVRFKKFIFNVFIQWNGQGDHPILLTITIQSSSSFYLPFTQIRDAARYIDGFSKISSPFYGKMVKISLVIIHDNLFQIKRIRNHISKLDTIMNNNNMIKGQQHSLQQMEYQQYEQGLADEEKIAVDLYHSYTEMKEEESNRKCSLFKSLINKLPTYLEVLWNELVPMGLRKKSSFSTLQALHLLQKNSNVSIGSLQTGFCLASKADDYFFILVYDQLDLNQGDLRKIIQQIGKQYCLVISEKDLPQKFEVKKENLPALLACKKNIAEEIVVFALIELNGLEVENFNLIHRGIKEEIQGYETIEIEVKKQYQRQEKQQNQKQK